MLLLLATATYCGDFSRGLANDTFWNLGQEIQLVLGVPSVLCWGEGGGPPGVARLRVRQASTACPVSTPPSEFLVQVLHASGLRRWRRGPQLLVLVWRRAGARRHAFL